jgi:hypothetical protein
MSVSFNWLRRTEYNRTYTNNRTVDPVADWTTFNIVNPLTGEQIPVYNLNSAKLGLTPDFYQTNADQKLNRNTYMGFEFGLNARLGKGVFFAGWTIDHTVDTACDAGGSPSGTASGTGVVLSGGTPGALTNSVNDPNTFRFCDQSGSLYQNLGKSVAIPYRHEFKIAGSMPVWKGFEVSMALQSNPELTKAVNWTLTSATRYPFDCSVPGCTPGALVIPTGVKLTNPSETIPLVAPGSRYLDRLQQLDLGIRRVFRFRDHITISPQLDVFNVNNAHSVLSETQALGTTGANTFTGLVSTFRDGGPGGTPQTLLTPRLLRLSVQFKF